VVGTISGVRFYRGHGNNSGYTVKLFSASGSLLKSATTAKDTCSVPCWEQVNFISPVSIADNTTYVVAYYTSNGDYADDENALTNGHMNSPLAAPPNGGVYTYSKNFPNQSWHSSNYYVDVLFTPTNRTLMLSFSSPNPSIPATAAPGTLVTVGNATWSDGSQFTGTLSFTSPYGNDNGHFALSGNEVVVGASGVAGDAGITQHVTVEAIQ
jgi:hypothetical protein